MHIPRIYQNIPLSMGDFIELSPDASHHLITVLRSQISDSLILFNGYGGEYHAVIEKINKRSCLVKIKGFHDVSRESTIHIHLFQSIVKGDKMDWIIQKAVELGVVAITPILTEYTHVNLPTERVHKKIQHWQKISENSAEQCGRTIIPHIYPALNFRDIFASVSTGVGLILHPNVEQKVDHVLRKIKDIINEDRMITILIGPEGGFSESEVQTALAKRLLPVSFGPRVLRVETAALAILSVLQFYLGDLN